MLRQWVWALALALVIPLGCLLLVGVAEGRMEGDWLAALEAEFGPVPAESRGEVALATLCADPEFSADIGDGCTDTRLMALLKQLIATTLILSVALVALAAVVAAITRGSRERMAAILRPALMLMLAGVGVLLGLQGALVIGALFEIQVVLLGRFWPWLLFAIGVAVLVSILGVLRAMTAMIRSKPLSVSGIALDRETDAVLFAEVDAIAGRVGTAPPDVILAGLEPNFFVVETTVQGLDAQHRGRVLFLSVPLCRLLSRAEFGAVIGHELGHFRGEDTRYSKAIAPMYAAANEALGTLFAATRDLSGLVMIPAAMLLGALFGTLTAGVAEVGRKREFEADAAGAAAVSAEALGIALLKLRATSSSWDDTVAGAIRTIASGGPIPNLAADYAGRARAAAAATAGQEHPIPHPFDTHPPIEQRLLALGLPALNAAGAAPTLSPDDPANALLGDLDDLETELSERFEEDLRTHIHTVDGESRGDPAESLREAAAADPGVAAVVALIGDGRGLDMSRPFRPGLWVAAADLRVEAHPDAHAFLRLVPESELPAGEQRLVVDVAPAAGTGPDTLPRGTSLRLVGINDAEQRASGLEEDVFVIAEGGADGSGLIVVRGVGPVAVGHQVAGLLVVPAGDPLAATAGPDADRVAAAVALLRASSPT